MSCLLFSDNCPVDLFPTDLMAAAAAGGPARGRKKKVLDHDDVSFGYW